MEVVGATEYYMPGFQHIIVSQYCYTYILQLLYNTVSACASFGIALLAVLRPPTNVE